MSTPGTKGLGALAIAAMTWSAAACGSSVILDGDGDGLPGDEEVTPPDGSGGSGLGVAPACAPGSDRTEVAPWEKASDFIALHDGWVYWTTHWTVERAPQAGGGPVELLLAPGARPLGVDVDDGGVFLAVDDGSIVRLDHAGGSKITLATDLGIGGAFTVVRVDGEHAYFRSDCGHLSRVPKGGGPVATVAETEGCFGGLALDDDAIYFVDSTDGHVAKVAKSGGPVTILADGALAQASGYSGAAPGIAIDDDNVYWVSGDGAFVGAVPKDGGAVTTVAQGLNLVQDVAVADGLVYWSEHGSIGRATVDGEGAITVTDEQGIVPMGLAIDGDRIFFTNYVTNGAVLGVCR